MTTSAHPSAVCVCVCVYVYVCVCVCNGCVYPHPYYVPPATWLERLCVLERLSLSVSLSLCQSVCVVCRRLAHRQEAVEFVAALYAFVTAVLTWRRGP